MSDNNKEVAESLEELLISIADGVREAQNSLSSAPPIDVYGRPVPTYHMPYLDFEVQVDMETVTTESGGSRLRIGLSKGNRSSATTNEISSKISGRLVAIPPGEGVPIPALNLFSEKISARKHKISLSATNSAGEVLTGQAVELNINLPASQQLSELNGITLTTTRKGTNVHDAILITDENGYAETVLDVDPKLPTAASLVLTAELGTQSANLTLQAGGK